HLDTDSRHLPQLPRRTCRRPLPPPPQPPPPPLPSTTHPCQQRHHNNDPLVPQPATPHQLASPPLPTTTHASNTTAASTRPAAPPSTPPPHRLHAPRQQRHRRINPIRRTAINAAHRIDSTRHATHASNAAARINPTRRRPDSTRHATALALTPIPLNPSGPTSSYSISSFIYFY
ncbi:hypothetical protein EDB85DRAFT_889864, partial [Lactarius pseudohatsudake]